MKNDAEASQVTAQQVVGSELEQKFNAAIDLQHFGFFEIAGFRARPILALKAGVAIGYKLACEEYRSKLKEMQKIIANTSRLPTSAAADEVRQDAVVGV